MEVPGFLLYESHYLADQNILVTCAFVRKLQVSVFEVLSVSSYN